jgi:hypothetical protein
MSDRRSRPERAGDRDTVNKKTNAFYRHKTNIQESTGSHRMSASPNGDISDANRDVRFTPQSVITTGTAMTA